MEDQAIPTTSNDTQELDKSWRTTQRDISELSERSLDFIRRVNNALFQPYYFSDAKRDFDLLMAQLDAIEKGLKPKTARNMCKRDLDLQKDALVKEKQDNAGEAEAKAEKLAKGTHEAARVFLRERSKEADEART